MKKGRVILVVFIALIIAWIAAGDSLAGWVMHRLYPRPYGELVRWEAAEFSLDENLLYAVMKAESGFDEKAQSRAGACGLMQLTPATFQWIAEQYPPENGGGDIFDPSDNLHCAGALLRKLLDHYGTLEVALAAYNAGMGNVSGWLSEEDYSADGKNLHTIPYPETDSYVKKVTKYYGTYKRLYEGGESG